MKKTLYITEYTFFVVAIVVLSVYFIDDVIESGADKLRCTQAILTAFVVYKIVMGFRQIIRRNVISEIHFLGLAGVSTHVIFVTLMHWLF